MGDVADVLDRGRRHAKTALPLGGDKSTDHQARQSLAQRAQAHAIGLLEWLEAQPRTRQQFGAEDVGANA